MFILSAEKNMLTLLEHEPVTSGSVNVYRVLFRFSTEWEELDRVAVFRAGGDPVSILLPPDGACVIPWEVLESPGRQLFAGVYGRRFAAGEDGQTVEQIVLPTQWVYLGTILPGAAPGQEAQPPPEPMWTQALEGKGDALAYTAGGELGLWSGDRLLSAVPVEGGSEGGTTDHRLLRNRDAEEQHPITSITGLSAELSRIPEPVEPLTNQDLEELLT